MEKVMNEDVTITKRIHEFYCDYCGEKLFSSHELDDGYYEKPKMPSRWIKGNFFRADIEKCVCEVCFEKFKKEQRMFYKKLRKLLEEHGYSISEWILRSLD